MRTRRRTWDPGSWQARTDRTRVLVEDPDGAVLDVSKRLLERQGFDVRVCSGPQGMGRKECPLVLGEGCPLAAGADLVYTTLAGEDSRGRAVLTALRGRYPTTPVVVEIAKPREHELGAALEGCQVVYMPCGQKEMSAAIAAALPVREVDGF